MGYSRFGFLWIIYVLVSYRISTYGIFTKSLPSLLGPIVPSFRALCERLRSRSDVICPVKILSFVARYVVPLNLQPLKPIRE